MCPDAGVGRPRRACELQTAHGRGGKQQSGQAVKTRAVSKHNAVTRAAADGQTWRTWTPSARQQGPAEGGGGMIKGPASTAYKSVSMGMQVEREGADFTLRLLLSCWEFESGVEVTATGSAASSGRRG